MKVHLKVTVLDRLIEKFEDASRANREVDFVTVTPRERAELYHDLRCDRYVQQDTLQPDWRQDNLPLGRLATYETRDFAVKPGSHRPQGGRWRAASYEKFMGKPLFVIPEWCVE